MKKYFVTVLFVITVMMYGATGGDCNEKTSDDIQRDQQESILKDATASVGMPAIKNHRERRLMKDILELRDQNGLLTYTYLFSEQTGKMSYVGESFGYGLPACTQFTNPMKAEYHQTGWITLPQADPNGLFMPESADGTWVMMKSPDGKALPVYFEPKVIVTPFKFSEQ